MSNSNVYKDCNCGRCYTREEWEKLQLLPRGGGRRTYDGVVYELRFCDGCQTTLARSVTVAPAAITDPPRRRPSRPSFPQAGMELQSAMLRVPGGDK